MVEHEFKEDTDEISVQDELKLVALVPLARLYFTIAAGQRDRARGLLVPSEHGQAVVTSLFFAVAALEAYLPEIIATKGSAPHLKTIDAAHLRSARAARKKRKRLEDVFLAGVGRSSAQREPWYPRVRCLRELRNALVHFDSRFHPLDRWPPRLENANARQVIEGWVGGPHDWTSQLLVVDVAVWGCATVRVAIERLHQGLGGTDPWSLRDTGDELVPWPA